MLNKKVRDGYSAVLCGALKVGVLLISGRRQRVLLCSGEGTRDLRLRLKLGSERSLCHGRVKWASASACALQKISEMWTLAWCKLRYLHLIKFSEPCLHISGNFSMRKYCTAPCGTGSGTSPVLGYMRRILFSVLHFLKMITRLLFGRYLLTFLQRCRGIRFLLIKETFLPVLVQYTLPSSYSWTAGKSRQAS